MARYLSKLDDSRLCQLVWSNNNTLPPLSDRKAFSKAYYVSVGCITAACKKIIACSVFNGKNWEIVSQRITRGKKVTQSAIFDMKIEKLKGGTIDFDTFATDHRITIDTAQSIYSKL